MFFTIDQIKIALDKLVSVHPFFGISFLVFKKNKLPIDSTIQIPIKAENEKFLDEYYKPSKASYCYYRVFRTDNKQQYWLDATYPGSLRRIIIDTFKNAFIHGKSTGWGWKEDYIKKLKLQCREPIPAFYLAVWLYRERDWSPQTTAQDVLTTFFTEFFITDEEKQELFDDSIPIDIDATTLFSPQKVTWKDLVEITGLPPDAPQEEGGTLTYLALQGVGPARNIEFTPGEHLTVITGDNGLGKTFLLECSWWALTGHWTHFPAYPRKDAKRDEANITFKIAGTIIKPQQTDVSYDWTNQNWPLNNDRPTIPGLLVYARVDGSFAVWDPARVDGNGTATPQTLVFSKDQVWNGLDEEFRGQKRVYSNGLLRDWIRWQDKPDSSPFPLFKHVLRRLSPQDMAPLEPGKPVRLYYDAREIPTLRHPYGEVPIVHAAAGIQRIVALAYLVVWAWTEHLTLSEQQRKEPQKRMVILVDEMEAHLHPKWQRVILPSLLDISKELSSDLSIQFIIATHSPLILASLEPLFHPDKDKLYHLNLVAADSLESEVEFEEIPFIRYGTADSWLLSDIFELSQTRSIEAEAAIKQARALQLEETPNPEAVQQVSEELTKLLAAHDTFWPMWTYFAEQHGAKL